MAVGLLFLLSGGLVWAQETIEYPEKGTRPVATFTAEDPEGASIQWSLGGVDAGDFTIENGVLRFKASPDFENPKGGGPEGNSNTYTVEVQATDETMKVGTETVMVKVTNVNEDGTVTLSARRPQTDTAFTAAVTDPDGDVADKKWQWSKASSKNGSYGDIEDANSELYTPKDADAGSYLRATVTYEDAEGEGKSAMMKSEFPSQRITGSNKAPKFADDQDLVEPGVQDDATRTVAENTSAGKTVGSPVVATDENADTLTYTLTNADGSTDGVAALFSIDWGTGQIMTKGALNHEAQPTYTVVVRATDPTGIPGADDADPANSDTVMVIITVTDVNEAPDVTGDAAVTFDEETGVITVPLDAYAAVDPDEDAPTLTWSVDGADGSKFTADGGELEFKKKPDYENPTDANKDNVYEVTVQASDGKKTGMKKVMVSVTNAEEDGVVTLSKVQPVVGIPVKATLTDPDGGISKLTWQWSNDDGEITDANSDTYTPVLGDVGDTLTATASYFDGQSPADATDKKTAAASSPTGNDVERDTRNKPPVFGDEDLDTAGVQNATATRTVEENTAADASDDSATDDAGDNVGGVVMATDTKAAGDSETLTYSLGGADAAMFRVRDNGQIEVAAGTMLDYETKNTYRVTVMAEDPLGASASIKVTIMVTDLDEMPDVSGDAKVDYAEKDTGPVATYRAKDPEGASVQWSLGGVDAGAFTIENGVLRFKESPDFENPMGGQSGNSSTYTVEVKATDETMKVGMETVMVKVTNENEDGTVTLSARRPQTDIAFTAAVTDLDGLVTDAKWQWAKASSKNGSYRDIAMATDPTYAPKDADAGSYLRATVTYEDPEGEGKSAMMKSEFPSQRITGNNQAPEFAADQDLVMPEVQDDATRTVAENTSAGKTVGSPVVATDENADTLTYTLTNADGSTDGVAALFSIDWGTGQIMTKGALNHEAQPTYTVVVRATDPTGIPGADDADPANSDTVMVIITVTDVNEAPDVTGDAAVTFDEETGVITVPLDTYAAVDPDEDAPTLTWSVDGADGSKFTADGGELEFKKKPDYENPTDANKDNVYEVTVQASDGKKTGMKKVMVSVTNAEEDGVVTLSKVQPVVGIPVKATLTDPDGGISKLTWQWSNDDGEITDANSDTYTPVLGDVGDTLTATASYFDGQSPADATDKKTAAASSPTDNDVERDTRNKPPVFGDEDLDTAGVQNATATRTVEENTVAASDDATDDAGDNVGGRVVAEDTKASGDSETLTYSLGGADAAMFRVRDNGQIEVAAGTMLDYETKNTYRVTVMAEDPLGASASIKVTIMVTDVDEMPDIMRAPDSNVPPEFASATTSRTVAENTEAGEDIGNLVAASDANGDALTYALSGTDTASFAIDSDTGQLMTLAALDYETKDTYSVTVTASDSGGLSDSIDVTITVTDVVEANVAPNSRTARTALGAWRKTRRRARTSATRWRQATLTATP